MGGLKDNFALGFKAKHLASRPTGLRKPNDCQPFGRSGARGKQPALRLPSSPF